MKKIISLLVCLMLTITALTAIGCGDKDENKIIPEHLLLGIEPGQHIMGMDIDVLGFLYSSGFTDAFYAFDDAGFHFPVW